MASSTPIFGSGLDPNALIVLRPPLTARSASVNVALIFFALLAFVAAVMLVSLSYL